VRELTEAELEQSVYLTLSETPTIWLLDLPARCVGVEYAEHAAVQAANTRYTHVRSTNRPLKPLNSLNRPRAGFVWWYIGSRNPLVNLISA
jgi:hypothetical protein